MRAAAVVAGAGLYALAFPPFDWSICAWVTLVPLLLILRDCSPRAGFAYGLLYGCAFGWAVTGWSAQAAARYFDLGIPVAVAALSVFYVVMFIPTFGVFGAAAPILLRSGRSWHGRFVVPALWVATELVRGRLMGQPWGLLGYSQHANIGLIQIAAVTGVYGVSYLLVWGNGVIANTIASLQRPGVRRRVPRIAIHAAAIASIWTAGTVVAHRGPVGGFAGRTVSIVQTNVPPALHWTRAYADAQLAAYVQATDALPRGTRPALVIWPENAIPRYLETDPTLAAQIADVARRRGADILFGTPRYESGQIHNSIRLITATGRNGGAYDKRQLVLFAERTPFGRPEAMPPSDNPTHFTAGGEPGLLRSFVTLGVSICHEIIYPEVIVDAVRHGAELLINVSNDGWLDAGSGWASRQHFAMATFRAVETRRYLVRGATTGVSGVVDPFGRILSSLPIQTVGTLNVPVAGRTGLTLYAKAGDAFAGLCATVALLALVTAAPAFAWRLRRRTLRPATRTA